MNHQNTNPYMNVIKNAHTLSQPLHGKVERVWDAGIHSRAKAGFNHSYGLYDNPLLQVVKPSARPWRRIIREIEHGLHSADTRVWLNDREFTGIYDIQQITEKLMGVKTVIIQITRNGITVSRLYATLGNAEFSLIGENRTEPGSFLAGRIFNFNEFITKELGVASHDARIICLNFIQAVTQTTLR